MPPTVGAAKFRPADQSAWHEIRSDVLTGIDAQNFAGNRPAGI